MKGVRDNNHAAKLNRTLVREIREKYNTGSWTQGSLARSYGVSVVQIGRIVRGESWGDMLPPTPIPPTAEEMLQSMERMTALQNEVFRQQEKEKELDPIAEKVKELFGQ